MLVTSRFGVPFASLFIAAEEHARRDRIPFWGKGVYEEFGEEKGVHEDCGEGEGEGKSSGVILYTASCCVIHQAVSGCHTLAGYVQWIQCMRPVPGLWQMIMMCAGFSAVTVTQHASGHQSSHDSTHETQEGMSYSQPRGFGHGKVRHITAQCGRGGEDGEGVRVPPGDSPARGTKERGRGGRGALLTAHRGFC